MLIGIDEAGRGAWAGPMAAAAVCLTVPIAGLKDSKLLSAAKRSELALIIRRHAHVGLGWASSAEIDRYGLTHAQKLCMGRALYGLPEADEIILDGHVNYLVHISGTRTLINADATEPVVMAASIIAKSARDAYMRWLARISPQYSFEKHVGYGTRLHMERLLAFGPCQDHRRSFKPIYSLSMKKGSNE